MDGEHKYQCADNTYNAGEKLSKSQQQSVCKLVCISNDPADNLPTDASQDRQRAAPVFC